MARKGMLRTIGRMNAATTRRRPAPGFLATPRNMAAVQRARERDEALVVSFVGDVPWPNETVYCDSGRRYDWDFMRGLHVVLAVRPAVDASDAMRAVLERTDTIWGTYPVLVDMDAQEVACIVHGQPVALWQVRRGTSLWQQYFQTPA